MVRTGALLWVTAVACTPVSGPRGAEDGYPHPAVRTEGNPVAVVGPVTLTTAEIDARIARQSPFVRKQLTDPDKRRAFIHKQVRLEVLAQEAWRRGLHKDPAVLQQVRQVVVEKLIQDEMRRRIGSIAVNESDLQQAYEKQKSDYIRPATVRLGKIVRYVKNDRERREARRDLDRVRRSVRMRERNGESGAFIEVARAPGNTSQSPAEGRRPGDDAGFVPREALARTYGDSVANNVFDELKIGDIVLAETATTVALLKKLAARRGFRRTYAQVKPQLQRRLTQRRRADAIDAFVDQLKREQKIRMFLDRAGSTPATADRDRETFGAEETKN